MRVTSGLILALAVAGTMGLATSGAFAAGCLPGDHIDKSTAAEATQKMDRAGYSHVHGLKKGCDNYWHALAMQDGKDVRVSLAPDGKVVVENDKLGFNDQSILPAKAPENTANR